MCPQDLYFKKYAYLIYSYIFHILPFREEPDTSGVTVVQPPGVGYGHQPPLHTQPAPTTTIVVEQATVPGAVPSLSALRYDLRGVRAFKHSICSCYEDFRVCMLRRKAVCWLHSPVLFIGTSTGHRIHKWVAPGTCSYGHSLVIYCTNTLLVLTLAFCSKVSMAPFVGPAWLATVCIRVTLILPQTLSERIKPNF